jgi:PKD repeat protein
MKNIKLYTMIILFLGILFSGQANAQCTANFTAQSNSNGSVSFTNTSAGNSQFTVYYWSFGDGTSSYLSNPTHQYNTNGFVSVCLSAYDSMSNCQTSFCDTILVSGASGATCAVSIGYQVSGSTVSFSPIQATSNIVAYNWWFGNGGTSTQSNPVYTYNNAGTYNVYLIAQFANGCVDTVNTTVTIASTSSCNAQFTYTQSGGGNVNFINQSTPVGNSSTPWISYYWSYGDGTNYWGGNNTHTYTSNGTYQACVWVIDSSTGCSDSYCMNIIIINANPSTCNAQFAVSSNSNGQVTFTNQSTGGVAGQTSYFWSFGNNNSQQTYSTSQVATSQYNSTGTYQVCLTMIDSASGCSDNFCLPVSVQVNGGCNANFSTYDSSGTFYFFPTSGNAATYSWNFGDGSTSTAAYPTHQYNSFGTYYVCLTVQTMGMTCTSCDTVLYYGSSPCNADFITYEDTTTAGLIYFSNTSTGNFTNFYWSFGDGSSSTQYNPVHTYTQQGTYLVCLTVYNNSGCQSSFCDSITIGTQPGPCTPVFYAFPDSTIGNGIVNFGLLNICGTTGWTYTWDFGDGTTAAGLYPVHVYQTPGTFYVCVDAVDPNGNVLTWCDSVSSNRIGSVGFNEISKNAIIAFPNPANDQVTIKNIGANQAVEIYSVDGKLIHTEISSTVDVILNTTTWNTGLYIVRINEGNNSKVGKISVQH